MCVWKTEGTVGVLSQKKWHTNRHSSQLIYSCFVLHNFCERNNRCGIDETVQAQILLHRNEDKTTPNTPDELYSHNTIEGENIREILTKYIVKNLPAITALTK